MFYRCGEKTEIAVARVIEEGGLFHHPFRTQAADHGEHQPLDHFDPFSFLFVPWFRAFCTEGFAVRD